MSESDASDDDLGAIGFMFDREATKSLRTFTLTSSVDASVSLDVPCWCQDDDEPGALQSGHYAWPAAGAL